MIDKGMVTAWVLGSLMLFVMWVLLPPKEHKEMQRAAGIQNPVARQGCLFLVLIKYLAIGLAIGVVFFAAIFMAKEFGLMNNTPIF